MMIALIWKRIKPMWIEYNKKLYSLSKAMFISKYNQEICIEYPRHTEHIYLQSQKETEDCWNYITSKLNPKTFGSDKMPC